MIDRSKKPKTKSIFKIPKIEPKKYLENDLEILYFDKTEEDIIELTLIYPLNSLDIPNCLITEKLSDVLEECGTEKYHYKKLKESYTYHGIDIEINSNSYSLMVNTVCLSSKFTKALSFIDQIIYHPKFDESEFRKLMSSSKDRFIIRTESPSFLANLIMLNQIFGQDNPIGFMPKPEDFDNLDIGEIKKLHKQRLIPRKPMVTMAGNVKEKHLKTLVSFINTYPNNSVKFDSGIKFNKLATNQKYLKHDTHKKAQASIRVFTLIPEVELFSKEYFDLNITNFIFGGGFLNSRLMQTLREEKGYTYGAYSQLDNYQSQALTIEVYSQVKIDSFEQSLDTIFEEMINLSKLKNAKNLISMVKNIKKTDLANDLESKFDKIDWVAHKLIRGADPQRVLDTYLQSIENFNEDTLHQTATKYFNPEKFCTVVVT